MNTEKLKECFAEQINRGITNLFFFTQEQHPREADNWRARVIPKTDLEELVPYLKDYTFYRSTSHMPRFYKE